MLKNNVEGGAGFTSKRSQPKTISLVIAVLIFNGRRKLRNDGKCMYLKHLYLTLQLKRIIKKTLDALKQKRQFLKNYDFKDFKTLL